jgi:hypothetical protein
MLIKGTSIVYSFDDANADRAPHDAMLRVVGQSRPVIAYIYRHLEDVMIDHITAKEIGGVLAGGLIATALLDTLMTKNLLSLADVRGTLQKVRDNIGPGPLNAQDGAAADVVDWLLKMRFPEQGVRQ